MRFFAPRYLGVSWIMVGFSPQIIPLKNRVFHYVHHPFWGVFPLFFGSTPIFILELHKKIHQPWALGIVLSGLRLRWLPATRGGRLPVRNQFFQIPRIWTSRWQHQQWMCHGIFSVGKSCGIFHCNPLLLKVSYCGRAISPKCPGFFTAEREIIGPFEQN